MAVRACAEFDAERADVAPSGREQPEPATAARRHKALLADRAEVALEGLRAERGEPARCLARDDEAALVAAVREGRAHLVAFELDVAIGRACQAELHFVDAGERRVERRPELVSRLGHPHVHRGFPLVGVARFGRIAVMIEEARHRHADESVFAHP